MERRLAPYLPRRGYFIEAGANDGHASSNTYFLEEVKKWRGLLVEPNPELAGLCTQRRPRSRVVQAALTDPDHHGKALTLYVPEDTLMAETGRPLTGARTMTVPGRTLESILDEDPPPRIHFMALDVEGVELSVLKGLNLDRYRPEVLLIETLTDAAQKDLIDYLDPWYISKGSISPMDTLFLAR